MHNSRSFASSWHTANCLSCMYHWCVNFNMLGQLDLISKRLSRNWNIWVMPTNFPARGAKQNWNLRRVLGCSIALHLGNVVCLLRWNVHNHLILLEFTYTLQNFNITASRERNNCEAEHNIRLRKCPIVCCTGTYDHYGRARNTATAKYNKATCIYF